MAKIYGINGVVSGRQGNNVYAVRNGEQVLKKYQPVVYNPNSEAQVATRAKLKMLSQLSAVMASAIAIPRNGAVSPRNTFTKLNFPATSFANGEATITLTSIKLTKSVVSLNGIVATRAAGNTISVNIGGVPSAAPYSDFSRVEYWAFVKQADGTLRLAQYASSNTVEGGFPASLPVGTSQEVVVYAYGVRLNTEAARVAYGDVTVTTAETIAKLIANRMVMEGDITLSETKAVVVPVAS